MVNNIETRSHMGSGHTEWREEGGKLIATGDLFLDKTPERALVNPETSRRMGERALNPWQRPGYIPGGAGPNSLRGVVKSIESSQNTGAYDREVLDAREAIGRFERKEE